MATRFEFILHGSDPRSLRAAGEEAMEEIRRLERELGFRQSGSEIRFLNDRAAETAVRVSPMLFQLLERAVKLSRDASGAFDITIAPLMRCWGLANGTGHFPSAQDIDDAKAKVGMDQIVLDRDACTVGFRNPGVMLDLGSIGKGYALDIAAEWLREAGVTSALIHGGTSTSFAIGAPPDDAAWKIAIIRPEDGTGSAQDPSVENPARILSHVTLADGESLSVSAVWGKSFRHEGRTYGHVIDPRSGWPVQGALLAAVVLPSAADSDALSTALLTLGEAGHQALQTSHPGLRSLVALPSGESYSVHSNGIELVPE